jgi:regulator of nonsense transcripts 2
MFIPSDSALVQSTKQQEAAELEEKQNIKRRILEYNEREEEEMNGGSSQMGNWGQGGSNTGSSIRSGGRGNWDGWIRGGARRGGGFYQGYGRRR